MAIKHAGAILLPGLLLSSLTACGDEAAGEVEQTNDSLNIQIAPIHYSNYSGVFDTYRKAYPDVELNVEDAAGKRRGIPEGFVSGNYGR